MISWLSRILNRGEPEAREGLPRIRLPQESYPTIYAIGDIHGRLDLLEQAEARILADIGEGGRSLVVTLGDYVDRGPDSAGVLRHLSSPQDRGFDRICLRGNHDAVMLDFCAFPAENMEWLQLGGRETLFSYGVDALYFLNGRDGPRRLAEVVRNRVPRAHLDFLANTPVCLEIGHVLFVHAGIEPGVPLDEQDDADMMWIREPFLSQGPRLPYFVVHGHTPSEDVSSGPGRIGIDTGAYATGKLTVVKIQDGHAEVL